MVRKSSARGQLFRRATSLARFAIYVALSSELIRKHNQPFIDRFIVRVTPSGQLQPTRHVISAHHHASKVSLLFIKPLFSMLNSHGEACEGLEWLQLRPSLGKLAKPSAANQSFLKTAQRRLEVCGFFFFFFLTSPHLSWDAGRSASVVPLTCWRRMASR